MNTLDSTQPDLRCPTKHELYRIGAWLFTHLFCGLLPLWGSWLLLRLGKQTTDLSDYVSHGEFCLYAAALAGTTLFAILREGHRPLRGCLLIGLLAAALLVSAALVFAGAFTLNYKSGVSIPLQLDITFLAGVSMVLYLLALVTAVITYFLEELRGSYDPRTAQSREQGALARKFHSIKD